MTTATSTAFPFMADSAVARAPQNPAPAEVDLREARSQLAQGNRAGALDLARAALGKDPRSFDAHMLIGELALGQPGNAKLAERLFRQALKLRPAETAAEILLAEACQAMGDLTEAETRLKRLRQKRPRDPRVLLAAVRFYQTQGRADEAVAALTEASRLDPANSGLALQLGHALKRSGRLLDALVAYRRAVGVETPLPMIDPAERPVRVAFIVQYPQGWSSLESVWKEFAEDSRITTTLIALPFMYGHGTADGDLSILSYLRKRNVPFVRGEDFVLSPNFADVVFFQLPYDYTRPAAWSVAQILKLVPRLAYIPYALEIGGGGENIGLLTNLPLHQVAWAICARSERHRSAFGQYCASGNQHVVVTGHPKMDILPMLNKRRDPSLDQFIAGRKMVIWNPHFDGRPDGTAWGSGYSTFTRWHRFLLDEFIRRPYLAFVIRPHPLFCNIFQQRRIMSQGQIDEFFALCAAADNVQIDRRASYLPVFASASALISDASSFILEFSATDRPLLYLHNPHGPGLNADGDFVRDYCATAQTEKDIVGFLDAVAAESDPRRETRRSAYRREFMHLPTTGAAVAIKNAILTRLREESTAASTALAGR